MTSNVVTPHHQASVSNRNRNDSDLIPIYHSTIIGIHVIQLTHSCRDKMTSICWPILLTHICVSRPWLVKQHIAFKGILNWDSYLLTGANVVAAGSSLAWSARATDLCTVHRESVLQRRAGPGFFDSNTCEICWVGREVRTFVQSTEPRDLAVNPVLQAD